MADPVIKKRPVILRLAELKRYPTLDDRYAATLPFRAGPANCGCFWDLEICQSWCDSPPSVVEKCIRRTGERWAWFSSARDLDDTYGKRLGTLIYLPWEIRRKIIEVLFDEDFYYCGTDSVRSIVGDRRRGVHSSLNRFLSRHESYYGLWLASPSTRSEMEHYYFSNTRFIIRYPTDLEVFADQLSTYEWSLLRLIRLEVCGDWTYNSSLKDWMSACARLPPNLVSITFGIEMWDAIGAEIHGHWVLVWLSRHVTPGPKLHRASILINTLGKLAHRIAAKAKIGLEVDGDNHKVRPEPSHIHHRVLDDLDPWSKDYLSWWEAKTKIDFEGDETINKAASNPYVRCSEQDKPWKIEL